VNRKTLSSVPKTQVDKHFPTAKSIEDMRNNQGRLSSATANLIRENQVLDEENSGIEHQIKCFKKVYICILNS
jgi:hypothetical protein